MFQYRQVLVRMRQGDTDRDIARARLMGRRKSAQLRELATARGWLDPSAALPEDEAFSKVGFIGVAMAGPGEAAAEAVSATEPGQYLMVCFIPQGTMSIPSQAPDASGPPTGLGDGPPHFTLGMAQEFTIGG